MAYDNLKQLGSNLKRTKRNTIHVTTRISKNFSNLEKTMDLVGSIHTYRMEFYTYTPDPSVYLDIQIFPKFRNIFY